MTLPGAPLLLSITIHELVNLLMHFSFTDILPMALYGRLWVYYQRKSLLFLPCLQAFVSTMKSLYTVAASSLLKGVDIVILVAFIRTHHMAENYVNS